MIAAFVRQAVECGVDIFRINDPMNKATYMACTIKTAVKAGKIAEGVIYYSPSPIHGRDYFLTLGKELKAYGCQSLCLADVCGNLTPSMAGGLISDLQRETGLPVTLMMVRAGGLAEATYRAALDADIDAVECTLSPFTHAASLPATETILSLIEDSGVNGPKQASFREAINYFSDLRRKAGYLGDSFQQGIASWVLEDGLTPAVLSSAARILKAKGQSEKFDKVAAELVRLREDLGWMPLVGVLAETAADQAVSNVLESARYEKVLKRTRRLAAGYHGDTPSPIAEDLKKKLMGGRKPVDAVSGDHLWGLARLEEKYGKIVNTPGDLVNLALYPDDAEALLNGKGKTRPVPEGKGGSKEVVRAYDVNVAGQRFHVEVKPSQVGAKITPLAKPSSNSAPKRPIPARPQPSATIPRSQARPAVAPANAAPTRPAIKPAPSPKPQAASSAPSNGGDDGKSVKVECPMQGTITKILVEVGEEVAMSSKLTILEAMKMENDILAPQAGIVEKILVSAGDSVQTGQVLVIISGN